MVYQCSYCNKFFETDAGRILHEHVRHKEGGLLSLKLAIDPLDYRNWSTLNPDERRIRIRNQVLKKLNRCGKQKRFTGPLDVEIEVYVDEFGELWMIKRDGKEVKICGAHRRGAEYAICCHMAGWGTDHSGFGRCKYHGGTRKKGILRGEEHFANFAFLSLYMNQPGHTLAASFKRIAEISSQELFDTETGLRSAYTILDHQLREGSQVIECSQCGTPLRVELSTVDIQEIRKSLRLIDRIIRTKAEISAKLVVDPLAIALFVETVMDVVMPYLKRVDRVEVAHAILTNALLPLGDRSHLTTRDLVGDKASANLEQIAEAEYEEVEKVAETQEE